MARVFEVYYLLKAFQVQLIKKWEALNDRAFTDPELRSRFTDLNNALLLVSQQNNAREDRIVAYADVLSAIMGDMNVASKVRQVLDQYQQKINGLDYNLQQMDIGYSIVTTNPGLLQRQLFGGAVENKRVGGDQYDYVTTRPLVKQATKITQPGITERRLVRENGHWSVLCERTGVDGIKQCKLYRIDEQNAKLIKIPIETNEVEVLKGATVNVENVPGLNGTSAVRQTVQPLVEKYATMRRLPAQDTGITFHRLPRASDIDTATGEPRITSVAEFDNQQLGTNYVSTQTNGGSADVKQGGAMNKKKGGAVTVPDPRKLFYHQFKLTDLDVKDAQQRLPDGTVAMPNEWANLGLDPLGANPGDVEYYAYDDDYGTTALHSKKTGFEFHFRYLPLSVEQEKSYLEWLIGVSMRMRIQHPQHFQFLYDSNVDTIATLEANILNGLARLEAHKVLFSRPKLFGGAASHENQLHKLLRIYALKPPTPIWISPMSMKYTNLPGQVQPDGTITRVASADVPEPESIVQNTLLDIRDELVDLAQNGGGFLDERGTGVKFPTFEGPDTTFADGVLAVGVLEAQVMSMLASLQFRYGLVVNFSAFGSDTDGGSYEATLMDNRRKKYLSADLKRYLDAFSNPADTRIFIRLPELRLRQAEAANIRLPPSTIPNVRKFSVNDSVTVVPTGIPASVETVVLTR